MIPLVVWPDPEREAIDRLNHALPLRDETYAAGATAGIVLPANWTTASDPFLTVALDGIPIVKYPSRAWATVRCTVYGKSTTNTKALAQLAQGLLVTRPGDDKVSSVRPLTGVLPARDKDTGAALASVTVRMILRPQVLVGTT